MRRRSQSPFEQEMIQQANYQSRYRDHIQQQSPKRMRVIQARLSQEKGEISRSRSRSLSSGEYRGSPSERTAHSKFNKHENRKKSVSTSPISASRGSGRRSDIVEEREKLVYQKGQDLDELILNSEERRKSTTRHSDDGERKIRHNDKKIFDYRIFLKQDFFQAGVITESALNKICHSSKCSDIRWDDDTKVTDIPGRVLMIESDNPDYKHDAIHSLLKLLLDAQTQLVISKQSHDLIKSTSHVEVMILIPEALVAPVIGGKGKQIKSFMDDSGASIVVNQPIVGMKERSVNVNGNPKQAALGISKIFQALERLSANVDNMEKVAAPIAKDSIKSCCKFVVKEDSISFIIGKHGSFTKYLLEELKVQMQCFRDTKNRALKIDESIVKMNGSLQDIESAIDEFCKRLDDYYDTLKKNFKNYPLAMLIPANLVTKLIGANGCMIKEISQKSGGPQIRVHSSKDTDRDLQEIVVTIDGSLVSKKEAACLVTQQLELFKNGGPVSFALPKRPNRMQILTTGQALASNLVGQVRSSLPFTSSSHKKKDDEERSKDRERERDKERDRKHDGHSSRDGPSSGDRWHERHREEREQQIQGQGNSHQREEWGKDKDRKRRSSQEDHRSSRNIKEMMQDEQHSGSLNHLQQHIKTSSTTTSINESNAQNFNNTENNLNNNRIIKISRPAVPEQHLFKGSAEVKQQANNTNSSEAQLFQLSQNDDLEMSIDTETNQLLDIPAASATVYHQQAQHQSFAKPQQPASKLLSQPAVKIPAANTLKPSDDLDEDFLRELNNNSDDDIPAPINYKRMSTRNLRGDFEVSISLLITPGHPVLSQIQDVIERKSGCQLTGLHKPNSDVSINQQQHLNPIFSNLQCNFNQSATVTISGDSKQLAIALKQLSDAIIKVEQPPAKQ